VDVFRITLLMNSTHIGVNHHLLKKKT